MGEITKKSKKSSIYFIIISVLLLFFMFQCSNEASKNAIHRENLRVQRDSLKYLKSDLNQVIASRDAYQVTSEELRQQLWVKDDSLKDLTERFKKVRAAFVIKNQIRLETGNIPLQAENELQERRFSKRTPYYYILGVVGSDFVRLDELAMKNTQRLVIGRKKRFSSRTITAEITNSNPYIKTTDLSAQVILEERIKRFGIGPFVGVDFGGLTMGVGLSYSLIRF